MYSPRRTLGQYGAAAMAETMEELQALPIGRDEPVSMVAQTTFSLGKYADFEKYAKKYYTNF